MAEKVREVVITMNGEPKNVVALVWAAKHDGGLTLFCPDTGNIFVCNPVGAHVWSALSRGLSVDAIASEVACKFDVSPEMAKRDALVFIKELRSRGCLPTEVGTRS